METSIIISRVFVDYGVASLKESSTNWGFHILGTSGKNSFCDTTTHSVCKSPKMSQLNIKITLGVQFELPKEAKNCTKIQISLGFGHIVVKCAYFE